MLNPPDIKHVVSLRLEFLLPQIGARIERAYRIAKEMGRHGDGARFGEQMEKERVADDQGRAVQDCLYTWASQVPLLKPLWRKNKNGLPHLEVYAGELFFTPHRVLRPGAFPQPAIYRQQNALANRFWLPGLEPEYDPAKGIYLQLLHGPAKEDRNRVGYALGFIQLAAPAPEKNEWLFLLDIAVEKTDPAPIVASVEDIPAQRLAALKNVIKKNNENKI